MKKTLMLLVASLLVASSAFAVLDSAPNNLGMYFDTNADVVCTTAAFFSHTPAYFILTNPTMGTLRGFEVGVTTVGRVNSNMTVDHYPVASTDVGAGGVGGNDYNYICGFSVPISTSAATVLAYLDIFWGDTAVDFILGPASPSSDTSVVKRPMVLLENYDKLAVDTSNEPDMPAAQINAPECSVVANEDASFGAVKALFR